MLWWYWHHAMRDGLFNIKTVDVSCDEGWALGKDLVIPFFL
jgi:hypothetical protein